MNFLWYFSDQLFSKTPSGESFWRPLWDFTSFLEEVTVFLQVNFDICPLGFIQFPEAQMRSKICWFQQIFAIETRSCYSFLVLYLHTFAQPFHKSFGWLNEYSFLTCSRSELFCEIPVRKEKWNIFRKTSVVGSHLIASYGNVLLETFAWKNSYSENSKKTV